MGSYAPTGWEYFSSLLGRRYANAEQPLRQEIFGQQLLAHVPLAARIQEQLEQEETGTLSEAPFIELLEEFLDAEGASP